MSFKFLEISAVKRPTEVLAMSRISVELDNTALHVAAACLDCTPVGHERRSPDSVDGRGGYRIALAHDIVLEGDYHRPKSIQFSIQVYRHVSSSGWFI